MGKRSIPYIISSQCMPVVFWRLHVNVINSKKTYRVIDYVTIPDTLPACISNQE